MKRVLQVVLNAEGTVGGEQRHVTQILETLDRSEFDPAVVTWGVPAFVAELAEHGIPTITVDARRILDVQLVRRIQSVIEEGRFDLVHVHGHRAGLIGRVAALRAGGTRIIWTCHLAENKAQRNKVVSWGYAAALRYLDRKTDATVAVSTHLRTWLAGQGIDPTRVRVITNGVDCDTFSPGLADPECAADLGLRADCPVVVCVARLTPQKGVETLVRASGRLAGRGFDHQVVIAGAGPLDATLRTLAAELRAPVSFVGERSDVPEILRLADAVVVPSLWEGAFCFTVLEAMASQRPLVCSDIDIFTDVVEGRDVAQVFAARDHASLAASLQEVLSDSDASARMALRGRELVLHEYSVQSMQSAMVDLYRHVLSGGKS